MIRILVLLSFRASWRSSSKESMVIMKYEREKLVERFQEMKRSRVPIIGGGAGTGISAKSEEAGGIDLIVIYNSGRYRMAGRGSAAGLLAFGNANEIVVEMAREVLPVVKNTPVLAPIFHRPIQIVGSIFANWRVMSHFRQVHGAVGL